MNNLANLIHGVSVLQITKALCVLGIDLGTTNSTIAEVFWEPGNTEPVKARCLEVEQFTYEGPYTHVLIPSVVAIYNGKVIVGEGAKRLITRTAELKLERNKDLFYECKNDIGIQKNYYKAPDGFRSATEIAGKVLDFIYKTAIDDDETHVSRTVVTVPASFQAAQRHDTLKAASLAGLTLGGGDLLDEPVAAFLDYLITYGNELLQKLSSTKYLLVFDFGGGTCDVAVFSLKMMGNGGRLEVSPLAVSRYHRLGGGDIDRAILYEILMPQILEQNGLAEFDLDYKEKKDYIEPSFLGLAEALKISLCKQIARLKSFKKYEGSDKSQVIVRQPGIHSCKSKDGKTINLKSPDMSAEQFELLLKPFLEEDLLYPRETEYRWTCSIFAPLQDALDRSGLVAEQIDYCLMVGGSSLIPQVVDAVAECFPRAEMLTYPDWDSVQTAVARGSAYHALALAVFGKGLVQPVCNDSIYIRTSSGLQEIIPKGVVLPYPEDGSYVKYYGLTVPDTAVVKPLNLRVEIVVDNGERVLFKRFWSIHDMVNKGDPLCLEYRYDENQILDLKMYLVEGGQVECFRGMIENPLTNVVNPQSSRVKIDELEEDLFSKKIPIPRVPDKLVELAGLYGEIGQREKARHYLKTALRGKKRPEANILNKLAIYSGELGDWESEEKYYREAAVACSWCGAWFNLALAQKRRRLYTEAIESVDRALGANREAPYLILRAMLAESVDETEEREKFLAEAMKTFDTVSLSSDWELGWLLTAAKMAGDNKKVTEARAEQKKRARSNKIDENEDSGLLPGGPSLPEKI
ncbi:MAG: Hsp70 family protein [Eubacteriales bacterium]